MTAKIDRFCKALTKSGNPCRAAATAGGLCFFHANPDKASELGRIGGRNKRSAVGESLDPLPALNSAAAVRDALARLIIDLHTGKIHPKAAAALARFLNLQLRAIEAVARLENRRKTPEGKLSISEMFRRAAADRKRAEALRQEQLIEHGSALSTISSASSQKRSGSPVLPEALAGIRGEYVPKTD